MKYLGFVILPFLISCSKPPSTDAVRDGVRRHTAESFKIMSLVGARIDQFFSARADGVDGFIDEVFSFKGKWRSVFWGREDFERHVRRRFESAIFRDEDFLREVVDPVRSDLAFSVARCEAGVAGDMAMWIRGSRGTIGNPNLQVDLSREILPLVVGDLGMNLLSIAGSEVASVAVIAGASGSWWTFGASLVAGIVAAIAIDALIGDELEDEARTKVRMELARMRSRMLDGPDGLWHASRRLLESHGRAIEKAAIRRIYGDHS